MGGRVLGGEVVCCGGWFGSGLEGCADKLGGGLAIQGVAGGGIEGLG
ncbi:MAG: hypothetical protein RI897_1766 [Verrucomicrobiota bacterium]